MIFRDRADRLYQSIELSSLDNESSKSHRDSSEVDLENEGKFIFFYGVRVSTG